MNTVKCFSLSLSVSVYFVDLSVKEEEEEGDGRNLRQNDGHGQSMRRQCYLWQPSNSTFSYVDGSVHINFDVGEDDGKKKKKKKAREIDDRVTLVDRIDE